MDVSILSDGVVKPFSVCPTADDDLLGHPFFQIFGTVVDNWNI